MSYTWDDFYRDTAHDLFQHIPSEDALKDVLKLFSPEDVLKQFSPEDVLKQFSPEDVLKQFSPEDVLRALSLEALLENANADEVETVLAKLRHKQDQQQDN